MFRLVFGLLGLFMMTPSTPPAKRPMTVDDLLAVKGVADPQVSPDGKLVVYQVSEYDTKAGKAQSDLWLVPVAGGPASRLTTASGNDTHPRWSPDGKSVAFTSTRSGSSQIWLIALGGGEARQLTKLPIDVSGPIWSPKATSLAFVAEVYPGKTPAETADKDKEKEESKSKARVYDQLMIRHWASWDEGKKSHLFVVDVATSEAKDLTPKLTSNTPPGPFGGSNDYAFSADGQTLAFTAEPGTRDFAWITNNDIWTVMINGRELKNETADNLGTDSQPSFSPDGKSFAWVSQARGGFEADQSVLKVRNIATGSVILDSKLQDRSVQSYAWESAESLIGVVDSDGGQSIARYQIGAAPEYQIKVKGGANTSVQPVPRSSGDLVFVKSSSDHPAELYFSRADGQGLKALTTHNDEFVAQLDLAKAEGFSFKGADGDKVSGWLIRPPGFDPAKKYPVVFLIHGGPQGAWHDEWVARWNYAMFAAPGYAVIAINPRGSTGYGQKFTDQISQDWNGKVYTDLMTGLDFALKTYLFLDESKMAAAGGSYGGYMVNWIAGHSDRFKALISHAGVFDLTSMYGTTEELWFAEWEFGGPPWKNNALYKKLSPSEFAENFKTPTLVIHGALDFRVPDAQGLGMFTCLQRMGVPSRYLWFPDEGHWILKPANRIVWWREMQGWLGTYLK